MPKVLVTPPMWLNRPGPYSEMLEQAGFDVVYPPADVDLLREENLPPIVAGIDAILAGTEPLSRKILAASKLRVVARSGVGFDSVDVAAATDLGIVVTNTPGAVDVSAAEHAMGLLLCLTRGLLHRSADVHTGQWTRQALPRLSGKTMGIVGLGGIGRQMARRAIGFDMQVIACDPQPNRDFASAHGIRLCSLDELLEEADIVSLHMPSTPETADLINATTLAKMKRGAILVNTSRGATVDENALVESLRNGHLYGAALDVFKHEPLPTDSPLLQLDNVVLCTHMAGLDEKSEIAMTSMAAERIVDLYEGRWPESGMVNRELKGRWRW